jgi:hypothetical protein
VSDITALLTLISLSLLMSTLLVRVLTRPLRQILAQLCPDRDGTVFWVAFTGVMLYVAPLMFALIFTRIPAEPIPVDIVRSALASSLAGAFAALLVVGYQLSRPRPR